MGEDRALVQELVTVLLDKKALNVLALDVENVSLVTHYVVIAEGNSCRHTTALGEAALAYIEMQQLEGVRSEGIRAGEWVVIDAWDVMIHIFSPGLRERFDLEALWRGASLVR